MLYIYICVFCHEKHLLWIEFSLLALPPLSQCVSIYAVYICGLHMWWPSLKLHGIRVTHSARNFANCPLTTRTLCQKTNLARPGEFNGRVLRHFLCGPAYFAKQQL